LDTVFEKVVIDVKAKWKFIGLKLGVPNRMNSIQMDCSNVDNLLEILTKTAAKWKEYHLGRSHPN